MDNTTLSTEEKSEKPRRRSRIWTLLAFAVAIALIALTFHRLEPQWSQTKTLFSKMPKSAFWEITGLYLFAILLESVVWYRLLLTFSGPKTLVPFHNGYFILSLSNFAKYLPGRIFNYVSQAFLLSKFAIAPRTIIEQGAWIALHSALAGLIVGGLAFLNPPLPHPWQLVLILGLASLNIAPFFLRTRMERLSQVPWIRSRIQLRIIPARLTLLALLSYEGTWILHGLGAVIFLRAANVPIDNHEILGLIGRMTLSAIVGSATPYLPGGIGAREAVLYLSTSNIAPEARLLLPVATRVALVAAELLALLLALPTQLIRPKLFNNE